MNEAGEEWSDYSNHGYQMATLLPFMGTTGGLRCCLVVFFSMVTAI